MKVQLLSVMLALMLFIVGCSTNSEEQVAFDEIAKGDIVKIQYRHGGTGLLYKTEKETEINLFIEALKATAYRKIKPNPWTGSGGYILYGKGNTRLIALSFGPNLDIQINGNYYKMTKDVNDRLKSFNDELFVDNNIVKTE